MAEVPKAMRPVGRTRWVTGFILVALGVAIWARAGWLGAFYRAGFGRDEWIRFGFWLWVGAVLVLMGLWLAYRSRVAAWAAGLTFVALFVVVYIHDYWFR